MLKGIIFKIMSFKHVRLIYISTLMFNVTFIFSNIHISETIPILMDNSPLYI